MYVSPNFKTKAALKAAVAAGAIVDVYSPGIGSAPRDGVAFVEGPHYPEPHRWYATVTLSGGQVVKVR